MKQAQIMLSKISDVKAFINIAAKYSFEIDLVSGRYAVDAKSIMGIFSLDLSNPITVQIHSDDCGDFLAEIEKYVVK